MVQIIPQQGSLGSRIGSGIGQGLSEQLPKEIERYRLSSGLEKLGQEAGNLSPFQQFTRLAGIPGITPAMLQGAADLLKFERKREGAIQGAGNSSTEKPLTQSRRTEITQSSEKPSITNIETEQALLQPNLPPSQRDIESETGRILQERPELSREEASELASKRLTSNYEQNEALRRQSTINDAVKSDIENEVNKILGNLGTRLSGETKNDLLNEAYDLVASGKATKLNAANEIGKKGLALAESLTRLQKLGSKWFPKAKSQLSAFKEMRDKFKGKEKLFANELVATQDLTLPRAKSISNPIESNKNLNSFLNSVKNEHLGGKAYLKNREEGYPREKKIVDQIKNQINPSDSLLAIALKLNEKGYNAEAIKDEISQLYRSGKISLSQPQIDELEESFSMTPSLGDFWLFGIPGIFE